MPSRPVKNRARLPQGQSATICMKLGIRPERKQKEKEKREEKNQFVIEKELEKTLQVR